MNKYFRKIVVSVSVLSLVFSCQKSEKIAIENANVEMSEETVSYAASQKIEGKTFIKKAEVNVEVEDVFKTTISLENKLKNMGGFVTSSNLYTHIISEKTASISDNEAELTRVYTMVNDLYVNVPSEKLADFLKEINEEQVFLHSRIITAEDVSANLKMAKWEENRLRKNEDDLAQLKSTKGQFDRKNENRQNENQRKLNQFKMKDQIQYSSIYFHLEEPNEKVSTIKIINTQSINHKVHFWHEMKTSIADGYYGILQFFIYLSKAWAFILIGILVLLGIKKWQKSKKSVEK